jgi:MFS family permease
MNQRRLAFLFLNLGHFFDHLFILIYATVAALALQSEFGRSYAELIIYATPMFVAFGAFALPAGWLADRWSRHGMMIVFFSGLGVTAILTSLAETPLQIGIGLFFIGVFASIYHPVGITMVVETNRERTGMALGINGVWGNMGVAFAAISTGALIDGAGWRAAFYVPGVAALATALAYAFFCARNGAKVRTKPTVSAKPEPAKLALDRRTLVRVFAIIALTTTLGSLIFQAITVSLPKVLEERLVDVAQSATQIGAWAFVILAAASLAQILIGHLVDRYSIKWVFVAVALLQVPACIAFIGITGVPVLAMSLVFMLLVFGQIPINDALLSRITTSQYRSRIYGVKFVLSFAVSAGAVPLVALLHQTTGFDGLFTLMAVTAAVITIAVIALPRMRTVVA